MEKISSYQKRFRSQRNPFYNWEVQTNTGVNYTSFGVCSYILICMSLLLILCTFPLSICLCIKVIEEHEQAVIFRLGRMVKGRPKGPGTVFVIPCIDEYKRVNLKSVPTELSDVKILSNDKVTMSISAVVYYRVYDAITSISNTVDVHGTINFLAKTTLQTIACKKNVSEIYNNRPDLCKRIKLTMADATIPWGIKIDRVEISDIDVPDDLKRVLSAEARAVRDARARVVSAEKEIKVLQELKKAADAAGDSPDAMRLQYWQTLNEMKIDRSFTMNLLFTANMIEQMFSK